MDQSNRDNRSHRYVAQARERRRQKAYGRWEPPVPVGQVLPAIEQLLGHGMSRREIARRAGIDLGNLRRILAGRSVTVTPDTAKAILGVTPRPASGDYVPAIGAARRLQALALDNWGSNILATRLGTRPDQVRDWRSGRRKTIHRRHHQAIAQLYDRLEGTPGPHPFAAVRAAAQHPEWVGADAWDPYTVDDPDAVPYEWQDTLGPDIDEVRIREVQQGQRRFRDLNDDERVRLYLLWLDGGGQSRGFRSRYKTRITKAMLAAAGDTAGAEDATDTAA
jgi:transcriptional regulator with XRE-family HTH domain